MVRFSRSTAIGGGWTRHAWRASNTAHEDATCGHLARRSAPRNAVAVASLREVSALRATSMRWGPDTSSNKLRQCARCTACSSKGATIQHPGWGGADVGFLPFPTRRI